ncbi:hypothetical protein I317_07148 [Kwoniella heveanensis CBS 569]|nr:hypothetical protein I317_07148 [Kwoniella heveanensis CBS 569]
MADLPTTPPHAGLRAGKRVPSGPRPPPLPLRGSPTSTKLTSASNAPKSTGISLRTQTSRSSFGRLYSDNTETALDALLDAEAGFVASPESSPVLRPEASSSRDVPSTPPSNPLPQQAQAASPPTHPRGQTQGLMTGIPMSRESSQVRSQTIDDSKRPSTPTSFVVSRPITPTGIKSPPKQKSKPKPSRLNTSNLISPNSASPTKLISPGMKHWQQVRAHVIAPTPQEEKSSQHPGRHPAKKMTGLVSKAAGRFGFKHAADHVIGYHDRRTSMMGIMADLGDLSPEEKENIARERRKFARDVKTCLDACSLEESRRRLYRVGYGKDPGSSHMADTKSSGTSVHASSHTAQRFTFDPEFSAFAPLLMELHKHLPAARAKKPWSRTCPHHSAILAELGVAFLQDSTSTDGERQQALEVFGAVVKNWASDNADEELERWLWLCRALLCDDRQLRNRGLALLGRFLHTDPALPKGPERPRNALAFLSLACDLLRLSNAVEMSGYGNEDQLQIVNELLSDLSEGDVIEIEEASLVELLGTLELNGSLGGIDKELMWMAVGTVVGTHPSLVPWLLIDKAHVLQRFYPPPILHATPPIILSLRAKATSLFLSSYATLVGSSTDVPLALRLWRCARDLLIPDVDHLPDEDGSLVASLATFLLELELQGFRLHPAAIEADNDPFRISMAPKKEVQAGTSEHKGLLSSCVAADARWYKQFEEAAKQIVMTGPLQSACRMLQAFLQNKAFLPLGRAACNALFERLTTSSSSSEDARPFLTWLSKAQPQLFYKPLFSCSASTQSTSLLPHLKLLISLSQLLGPFKFWTQADPQMIIIVLMGEAIPKQPKGKGKEGEIGTVNIKLGRYAVLAEFVQAFEKVDEPAGSGSRLRTFIEAIEARLGVFLEAEEKEGSLPDAYRGLVCQLLLRLRSATTSLKRATWHRLITSWFSDLAAPERKRTESNQADEDPIATLKAMYQTMAVSDAPDKTLLMTSPPIKQYTNVSTRRNSLPLLSAKKRTVCEQSVYKVLPTLLVTIHACLATEEWEALLPRLWHYYDNTRPSRKSLAFMLQKCAEKLPLQLRAIIASDLSSTRDYIRSEALKKIAMLFGWRYQVLAQRILTDRRGPVFQFTAKTLEFVSTEIGSPEWAAPHDVQDAALQKFGRTLPLELRQKLMELGWSEDQSLQGKSDWEAIPVTALPALQYQQEGTDVERSPSPMRALTRTGSNGSGNSVTAKRRKAVFAPTFLGIVSEQADLLAGEVDGPIVTTSRELIRLLQRDDPTGLLRPIAEGLSTDLLGSLARLNGIIHTITPGFAYAVVNSLVGHLKVVMRNDPSFPHHATAITTIARLVPGISEISLRDIRKNKAEHILLPASIHEDEGGFKVHGPWRDNQFDIQTAQLVLVNEGLRANPREVYLVKKMLSNLQIRDSIPYLPFARAWLILITTLFATVNRNYNDRAELRHFLSNVAAILTLHGQKDILITSHVMRVFMLCSARFRRLFTSMGFSTIMRSVYETFAGGSAAHRDCIEYAARSFYRIHQDSFVYQACVAIAEGEYDASAVYTLLSSLSRGNTDSSGISSGVKDLNNQEELEALVQMLSGPEIALSDLGTAAAERQATRLASITLEDNIFPKENIVKLFITVIAANPATARAASFLRLLSALIPHIKDSASQDLLRESIEVLGSVIQKGRTGDEAAMLAFHPGSDETTIDWTGARREYVFLVESFARSGGHLGASPTKRTLNMVLDLLKQHPESVGPAASSIVSSLANTHLSSTRPTPFLREIAPLFRMFIAVVDFSGMLDSITALIKRSGYNLDPELTAIIVENYVEPSIRMLASASEDSMVFIVPLRSSAVKLLSAAVFLRGDALGALERHPPGPSLLASLVMPLCLLLDSPAEVDREALYSSLWMRLLNYVLRPSRIARASNTKGATGPQVTAARIVVTVQIIKIIAVRAPDSVSSVKGLWTYIARHLLGITQDGDAVFAELAISAPSPRVVDWIMWSIFEFICLHKSPLIIDLRARMQIAISAIQAEEEKSNPPSPGLVGGKMSNPPFSQSMSGRARRISSMRTPSGGHHSRMPSAAFPDFLAQHSRNSSTHLTPETGGHSRMPSQHLTPFLSAGNTPGQGHGGPGHARMPSQISLSAGGGSRGPHRPSFADLSARRASRPAFDAFPAGVGMNYRFPSSAGVRNLRPTSEKAGGAIIHLLAAPNQVLSATSSNFPTLSPTSPTGGFLADGTRIGDNKGTSGEGALRDHRIKDERLSEMARRAVRVVRMINGWEVDYDQNEEAIRTWSVHDALHVIAEQTKLFVESEFKDVFSPSSSNDWTDVDPTFDEKGKETEKEKEKDDRKRESGYSSLMAREPEGFNIPVYINEADDEHGEGGEEEAMMSPAVHFNFNERRRSSDMGSRLNGGVPLVSVSSPGNGGNGP